MSDELERMKKKTLLLNYYAQNGNNNNGDAVSTGDSSSPLNANNHSRDPYDINTTSFEPDLYLKKLIKVNPFIKNLIKNCIKY